jgi:ferredoxin
MAATIFYYTGTGNSLWIARKLSEALGGADVVSIPSWKKTPAKIAPSSTVGLVFPVHMWGLPRAVRGFLGTLGEMKPGYAFAVAVNAGQVSNTLVQLKRELADLAVPLNAGFGMVMPTNYIPWGGPGPKEKQNERFEKAGRKIAGIAQKIRTGGTFPVEKGPLWQRILFTGMYKMSYPHVPEMDKKFWVDEKCNRCGICEKVCPAGNIALTDGNPRWNHHCEQCLACIQWCPKEAIQYGKKTSKYERYHHPEIALKDMLPAR